MCLQATQVSFPFSSTFSDNMQVQARVVQFASSDAGVSCVGFLDEPLPCAFHTLKCRLGEVSAEVHSLHVASWASRISIQIKAALGGKMMVRFAAPIFFRSKIVVRRLGLPAALLRSHAGLGFAQPEAEARGLQRWLFGWFPCCPIEPMGLSV